jgi:hypothetical protein
LDIRWLSVGYPLAIRSASTTQEWYLYFANSEWWISGRLEMERGLADGWLLVESNDLVPTEANGGSANGWRVWTGLMFARATSLTVRQA